MNEKEIKLHPKQWEALNCDNQFIACISGVQGGKSFLGSVWAQKKINEFPDKSGAIIAPTYKILIQSTLEKFFQIFPEYKKFYKQQQGIIELPTGGKIFIRSADDPLGLEGMTLNWAWLDEAGMMKRLVWQIIRSRVSVAKGQVLITTTPYFENWLYREFFIPWKENRDNKLSVFTWKSIDNPYFPKDFYEEEKARLSPKEFARRYEGEFVKMSGLVYELEEHHIIKEAPQNYDIVIAGIDWGYNNPSAIAVIGVKDKVFYLIDEFYESQKTTADVIQKAKIFYQQYRVNEWYPDPAEPDRMEEMRRAGLYPKETNKDIKFGISKVQEVLRGRFYVLDKCVNAIEEFNTYHYDEEKMKELPVKENDHLMDAIRYAIVGYSPIRKPNYDIYFNRKNYGAVNSFE